MRKIKDFFQLFIIRTTFFPFNHFYSFIYSISIKAMCFSLSRIKGVVAVYLRRGTAKGEIIYGLSDIDLSVVLEDGQAELTKGKVCLLYKILAFFMPAFGPLIEELGIYTVSEFFNLYKLSPFFKFRVQRGKSEWKLLYGEDLVKGIPATSDNELTFLSIEELKMWWYKLQFEWKEREKLPEFKRKYLWYKAVADAAQIYLSICKRIAIKERKASIDKIKVYLDRPKRDSISELQNAEAKLFPKKSFQVDKALLLFMNLTAMAAEESEKDSLSPTSSMKAVLKPFDQQELFITETTKKVIKEIKKELDDKERKYNNGMAVFPQIYLGPDALYSDDIDTLNVVLFPRDDISLDYLRKFFALVKRLTPLHKLDMYFYHKPVAYFLGFGRGDMALRTPRHSPVFFSLLNHAINQRRSEEKDIISSLNPYFDLYLKHRAKKINELILQENIYKMSSLNFGKFFWAAARTKLLHEQLGKTEISIPLNSHQMVKKLEELYPQEGWLTDFFSHYLEELKGLDSRLFCFYSQAHNFLKIM